jgi:hypothetical protein
MRISRACKASVCIINMYLQITDIQTRQSDDKGKGGGPETRTGTLSLTFVIFSPYFSLS